jgi:hypothetical protein
MGRGSARRKAATYIEQHKLWKKRKRTSMPRVGLEPTTLEFQQATKFRALDRTTTMTAFILFVRVWNG